MTPVRRNELVLANRQRLRRLSLSALRELITTLLKRLRRTGEIGFHFVNSAEIARINWQFLQHEGSTDIITFDHGSELRHLRGECYICISEAIKQAVEWQTTWSEELGRYILHGLLHLAGYDDIDPMDRRAMKRRENALTIEIIHPRHDRLGR